MSLASIITSVFLVFFGFAGGGGSDSGGGGGSDFSSGSSFDSSSSSSRSRSSSSSGGYSGSSSDYGIDDIIGVVMTLIVYSSFFAVIWVIVDKHSRRHRTTSHDIATMTKNSHESPQEKQIREQAEQIFKAYQSDWTNFNVQNIATYTTPEYYQHAALMLELLKSLHRVNKVSQLEVEGAYVMASVKDNTPLPVKLKIKIYFSGLDEVIDTETGDTLYSDHAKNIHETWNFIYDGQTLKLSGVSQPTESAVHLVKSLADFANKNHLFYSPDWGRYALPSRGLIFSRSTMQTADINNHILGKWGGNLVQLYTYAETPGDPSTYYIVGQITLPKSYLGVIVKPKHRKSKQLTRRIPKSYAKFELEWPKFNQRYEVHAASADALPAFELLNPKFMEYLYRKNSDYSLEVVDNTIYIFANIEQITDHDYVDLLDALSAAYQELKQ